MPDHTRPAPFENLANQVPRLWERTTPGYDAAREQVIWNRRLDKARAPDAVVRCASNQDVAAAISFARNHNLKVALRGSGHSYHAAPLCSKGLLLDLGQLNSIEVNPQTNRARVGPGARGRELIDQLVQHDLAFPIGHCASVALGGYILSGGIGWHYGAWGPASHNLASVELITAAGDIMRASEEENADLFWAVRGAGCAFFAAVTAYELILHPLPQTAWLWSATFNAQSAPALADWLTAATAAAHPAAEIMCLVRPGSHLEQPQITIRTVGFGDTEKEAQSRVASFRSPPPQAELLGPASEKPMDFASLTKLSAMPDNKRVAADHSWCDASLGDMLLAVYQLASIPEAPSTINLVSPGGNGQIPFMHDPAHSALSAGGGASAGIYAMWDDPADDAGHCEWVQKVDATLSAYRTSRYIGEADLTAGPERLAECFAPAALARLNELRRHYDPNHLFHSYAP